MLICVLLYLHKCFADVGACFACCRGNFRFTLVVVYTCVGNLQMFADVNLSEGKRKRVF